MFGKVASRVCNAEALEAAFQSPCAGNMFGKDQPRRRLDRPDQADLGFQSPCAGNMFGKALKSTPTILGSGRATPVVSIPVCGEHVW